MGDPNGSEKYRRFLEENIPLIDEKLYSFLPKNDPLEFLYNPMRDYPERGGKRLRPALVILSCEALGGKKEETIWTAVAFELLHLFLIVHDDIEDGSEMRRGEPCLHRKYGVPLSLNAGDALFGKVFEALLENRDLLGDEKTFTLMEKMITGFQITCEGQAYDLGWIREGKIPDPDDFFMMLKKKTGWYTGRGPCDAGAIIADADEKSRRATGNFGETIAMAFQIRDDLLNLVVESGESNRAPGISGGSYGKERGGDIAEGKRTLMIIDLFGKCQDGEREKVSEILNRDRNSNTPDEIEWVISLLEEYDSINYAKEMCKKMAHKSVEYLNAMPEGDAVDILKAMSDFLVERDF